MSVVTSQGAVFFDTDVPVITAPYGLINLAESANYLFAFSIINFNKLLVYNKLDYSLIYIIDDVRTPVSPPAYTVHTNAKCDGEFLAYTEYHSYPSDHPAPGPRNLVYVRPVDNIAEVITINVNDYGFPETYSAAPWGGYVYISSYAPGNNYLLKVNPLNSSDYELITVPGGARFRDIYIINNKLFANKYRAANDWYVNVYNVDNMSFIRDMDLYRVSTDNTVNVRFIPFGNYLRFNSQNNQITRYINTNTLISSTIKNYRDTRVASGNYMFSGSTIYSVKLSTYPGEILSYNNTIIQE